MVSMVSTHLRSIVSMLFPIPSTTIESNPTNTIHPIPNTNHPSNIPIHLLDSVYPKPSFLL